MMKNIKLLLVIFIPLLHLQCTTKKEKQMIPPLISVKDFFKNPNISSYKISPDGNKIAYKAPYKNRMNIFIKEIKENAAPKRLTSVTDRDISNFIWKGSENIIYERDNGGNENWHLYAINIDGSKEIDLTPFPDVMAQIIDDLEDNDDKMIIGLNKRNPQVFDPYLINIKTGEMKLLYENPGNIGNWITDHEGKIRIATITDGVNTSLLYRKNENEKFKTILTTNFKESIIPLFFDFDNGDIIYASSNLNGRDKSAIIKYNISENKEIEVIYKNSEVDVSNLNYSKKRKKLSSITYTVDKIKRIFLDEESKKIFEDIKNKLNKKGETYITSINKDETIMIVYLSSDLNRGEYYIYNSINNKLTPLEDIAPWIKSENMAEMNPIKYKSRDGLNIRGYLTLPKGIEAKKLPLVVNPHGGPWYRDFWGFNPEVQLLANRGYAVLQVNFRGSTGFGREFWEKSFKQWGQSMQNDITDGVQWLVEQGIVDEKRIAIYGASYGGYATLMGIVKDPNLYACAVDYVGVSSLLSFMESFPPYWEIYKKMMFEMVGNPNTEDSVMLKKFSPVLQVHKIKTPLFIAQGANDPRVKKSESDQMVEALKQNGINVLYMVKDNEGHGFRNEENKFDFYQTMDVFLDNYLKGKGAHEESKKAVGDIFK